MASINASSLLTTITPLMDHAPYYYQFRKIHRFLVKITFPYLFFIAFIGLITNTLTVILLSKSNVTKNLKNKWTLIALALSDLLFNTVLFIRAIHDILKIGSDRLCLMISFLSHLAELLSAFYTVSFTIQRYHAIRCPFEAAVRRRSSPLLSLLFIFVLSSIFCLLMCYYNRYEDCHEELYLRWFIADALLSFVIPFLLILTCNALIVASIRKHSHAPRSSQPATPSKLTAMKSGETCKTDLHAGTLVSMTNVGLDGNETIELQCRQENKPGNEINHQEDQLLTPPSPDGVDIEVSSIPPRTRFFASFNPRPPLAKQVSRDSFSIQTFKQSFSLPNGSELTCEIPTRASQSIRVTRMLVLVSTCFLLLNAPGHICVLALKIYVDIFHPANSEHIVVHDTSQLINQTLATEWFNRTTNDALLTAPPGRTTTDDRLAIHVLYIAVLFTQLITYASYSINFFLYSYSGIAFQTSLRQVMKKFRPH